jgi:hypothetical protein
MHYPTFAEYCDVLSLNLGIVLSDPLLGRGTLRMRGPGLPVAHSGNFALTFEVVADGAQYAVRCFHKPTDSLHERYTAITAFLQSIRSPCFVACQFQPTGITTESGTYPIVRMAWAPGQTLAAFVAQHRNDVNTLQVLRASLQRLAGHLRQHGIAHGDIQPGNVIVQDAARLRLIDYDGLFVPRLAQLTSAELGQRNFQHPARRAGHFDAELDRFSFAVIDLALDALSRRALLWEQTDSDEDAFLLRAADFADPANSPVFSLLSSVPGLERRVHDLAAICMAPFEQIPALEDFLAGRNIPPVTVRFSGDASRSLRSRYVSVHEIVDARNFARCCAHVGDRVELIGRIVRVASSHATATAAASLRVEFAERSHDVVCLKIWPDALAGLTQAPDQTWVGQWLSTVGLVEPVHSAGQGTQRRKYLAISITEQSQLHRLTETEAQHRLRGQRRPTGLASDQGAGVRTDPVVTEPVSQADAEPGLVPRAAPPSTPLAAAAGHAPPRPKGSRASLRLPRWWRWAAGAVLATGAVLGLVASLPALLRTPPTPDVVSTAAEPVRAEAASPAAATVPARLLSQQDLRDASPPLVTQSGSLAIASHGDGGKANRLLLDGIVIPGLRDDVLSLAHRAVFTDREVVVGFSRCNGPDYPCALQQPYWLELRRDAPPVLRRLPGLWASSGAGAVTATDRGAQIDLGLWNGERRTALLTAGGNILVSRAAESGRALSRADCAEVIQAAESCSRSRDCSSFAASARPISAPRWARLQRLHHETTGLDAAAFRALCVRSCELGLTPSRSFIRRTVCSGAQPGQWLPVGPDAGLMQR